MLAAPDIREGEPAHVGESRNLRQLVFGVVPPDESNKHFHQVHMFVGYRGVTCDWEEKVNMDPPLDGAPQHVLVESWQIFTLLADLAYPRGEPRARRFTP